jgi:general secretion pathway protein B
MSFILDALKKSESDRQRQSGPALFEVKVTPPKPRFPYWALALAALLVINIVVGAWVYLRRPPAEQLPTAQSAATSAPSASSGATPPQVAEPPASHAAPLAALAVPPASTPAAAAAPPAAVHPEPVLSDSESRDAPLNPDDYEPAVAPGKQEQAERSAHVRSGTESGLVSYADAASNPDLHLPALRIDLHVYATNAQERFVLINMHRLHEGDALPAGGRVESITPEGAIVSFRGSKFFLEHQ